MISFSNQIGRQEASDATVETLKVITHHIAKQALILVEVCSFAGTSEVLKIQAMLHHCNDHVDKEKEDDTYQAFAVLGIALVAMGEDVGAEMSLRTFNHLVSPKELDDRNLLISMSRCITVNLSFVRWCLLLLDFLVHPILRCPSWTHYLNIATTMILE